MEKVVAALLGGAVVLTSLGPAVAGAGKRAEVQEYMSPAAGVTPVHPTGAAVCNRGGIAGGNRGCVEFTPKLGERFVSIEVTDATGLPVPAFIQWNDTNIDEWVPFCGKTAKPLPILGTATVWPYPYRSPNLPTCAGTATTGEVTATFMSERPRR